MTITYIVFNHSDYMYGSLIKYTTVVIQQTYFYMTYKAMQTESVYFVFDFIKGVIYSMWKVLYYLLHGYYNCVY